MSASPIAPGQSATDPNFYGNIYVAADGDTLWNHPDASGYYEATYGNLAFQQWVLDHNRDLLRMGLAIDTPDGVQMLSHVIQLLEQHGYTGALDAQSVAQAYKLLQTPPPGPASGTTPPPLTTGLGSILHGVPQPLLLGGGALLVFMLLFRRQHSV